MKWFLVSALVLAVLVPNAQSATDSIAWCYHLPSCNYTTWPTIAAPFCNGTRQSPININTSNVVENSALGAITIANISSTTTFTTIENTGRTIKVNLQNMAVTGGGLGEQYTSLQFHLHWGNGTAVPGSEHTVDGKTLPMELHIVNHKSSLNLTQALNDPAGLAALGFFIEESTSSETPESWQNLTSYLKNITLAGQSVSITHPISIMSLLNGASLDNYYRYNGSLTTPSCNEVVVWTVFNDTIKVPGSVIQMFSEIVRINDSTSPLMVNVFRPPQSPLEVSTNVRSTTGSASSTVTATCMLNALSLAGLVLLLWRD